VNGTAQSYGALGWDRRSSRLEFAPFDSILWGKKWGKVPHSFQPIPT
jgi:hypothetical protein